MLDLLHSWIAHGQKVREEKFRIEESGSEKVFKYGNVTYSKIKKGGLYTGEYWDYFIPIAYISKAPRLLLIGLGGGTIAFQLGALLQDAVSIDAVEISKRAVELSKDFLQGQRLNVNIGDGAEYLHSTNKKYDAIIVDAYASTRIPDQFLGEQFVEDAHGALEPDGVLAVNYAVGLMGAQKLEEYALKLRRRFHAYSVRTAITEGNVILLASKSLGKAELVERIGGRMPKTPEIEFLFRNYIEMKPL